MSLHERLTNEKRESTEEQVIASRKDFLIELTRKTHSNVISVLGGELYEKNISVDEIKTRVREKVEEMIREESTPLTAQEQDDLIDQISNDALGYGPLQPLLADEEIDEVMVNGYDTIYVEKKGKILKTEASFIDEDHLRRIIDKIVAQVGRRIDESSPMVDARLPDGSRVNAIITPLAIKGSKLTIRKFAKDPFTINDLIGFSTLNEQVSAFLDACVRGRQNMLISGGTGSGKTSTLNVLSSFIPAEERIITIEDSVELQLNQEHVLQLESRMANIEGKGEVTIRDLVRNSLRMRPDRIVVGEVRGGETLDMLQAMNTGHDGSLSTVHANSPRDVLSRLETMVLMSGMELPIKAIREQIASAIDLIVHQARLRDGSRHITHVTEVQGMEGDVITLQDIFLFDFSKGRDPDGKFIGELKATGIRPKFVQQLEDMGIEVPLESFKLQYILR